MSKEIDNLRQLFNERLRQSGTINFYGEVIAVDEATRTCTVEMNNIHYENILLYSIEKSDLKGFVMIPEIGSIVLVSKIMDERYFVSMFSEISKIIYTVSNIIIQTSEEGCTIKANDSIIKTTPGGITIDKGKSGLKKTLNDLLDAIMKLTVSTAVGPSSVPINNPEFLKIKQDLVNYLE